MTATVCVINPNSTRHVTDGIHNAVAPLGAGVNVVCHTLAEGPPAIETRQHVEAVVAPLTERIRTGDADAWVIACYSDPGLDEARAVTGKPVFGIAECAMLTALTRGRRFGVVSILDESVERHLAYIKKLGLTAQLAGDRAVGLGVLELESAPDGLDRMINTGKTLRDDDGADVLILGCAGMARQRGAMEDALGIPVIEPCQAAVAMASGALLSATASS